MATKKAGRARVVTNRMQQLAALDKMVSRELEALAKKYGAEDFRIVALRYFKREREQEKLRAQIAEREAELERLRRKSAS